MSVLMKEEALGVHSPNVDWRLASFEEIDQLLLRLEVGLGFEEVEAGYFYNSSTMGLPGGLGPVSDGYSPTWFPQSGGFWIRPSLQQYV